MLVLIALAHVFFAGEVVNVLAVSLDFALAAEVVELVCRAHGC